MRQPSSHIPVPPQPFPPDALELRELSYSAGGRTLLDRVSLTVAAGTSVALSGPSGAGKSTLLSCALGLLRPKSGKVVVAGTELGSLGADKLARLRAQRIGMVFQFGELIPELTARENTALPALLARQNPARAYEQADSLLTQLAVPAHRTVAVLSGGERQRTAVARALVNSPLLVLADEPTGALDPATRDQTAELLFSLPHRFGCGLLVVTHDPAVAERADRTAQLEDGVLSGRPMSTERSR